MSPFKVWLIGFAILSPVMLLAQTAPAKAPTSVLAKPKADDAVLKGVRDHSEKFSASFNAGKIDDLASMFLAEGEYIDEKGTVYQGQKEIKDLFAAFFKQFPETKLAINVESARALGPVVIEEGTRTMTLKDGTTSAQFRFIAIWTKADAGWKLASFRDVSENATPTAYEALQPLGWLAGDWVNEGADASVAVSFKWSEDKSFLLGDFQITTAEGASRKSTQRFGWDPSSGKIRTWLFDSDGGFAEGIGTLTQDGLVIKFSSVNPNGTTGSATITFQQKDKNRYSMIGSDRVVADSREPDFEIDVVRRPPPAATK